MQLEEKVGQSTAFIHQQAAGPFDAAIILGSGLGAFAETLEDAVRIPFAGIPHFPSGTVEGHAGTLVTGRLQGRRLAVMQGRVHYYEGFNPEEVVYPARVLFGLGIRTLIVTNAAGGINRSFRPGDLMLVKDHINLMGFNPLRGSWHAGFGPRFCDMSRAYPAELRELARRAAAEAQVPVQEGVYLAVSGPSFETPAEIRMFATCGADAVGMSTVPEVICANQMGMKVLCISCITNMAAGLLDQPLSHREVLETTAMVRDRFLAFLSAIVRHLPAGE